MVNEGIEAFSGAFVNLNFQSRRTKEVEGLLPPSATADTLSEDTRRAQPGPSRQVRRQSCMLSGPCIKTTRRTTPLRGWRRDETRRRVFRARPSAFPQSGQGAWQRSKFCAGTSVSLWILERCHCWSPAWPLSWLLGVVVKADHHCCEAKVQKPDAAYHML